MAAAPTKTVFLIHESRPIRHAIAGIFNDSGYRVITYYQGDGQPPDLGAHDRAGLLIGVPFQGLDGPVLMQRLHELSDDHPLLVVTHSPDLATDLRVQSWGRFGVLQLPLEADLLVDALEIQLDRYFVPNSEYCDSDPAPG